ncbi:MAG TPA: hypothetical protein VFB16_03105 [Bauldia sp.]|nr:hypothetical protein [Bauldia sp.]
MIALLARAVVAMAGIVPAAALAADNPATPITPGASAAVCRNAGNVYKVGEFACIAACHGERRLARCDAGAQMGSWTFVSNVCPSAMLPPSPSDANVIPVAVAMTPIPLPIEHKMSEMSPEAWMKLSEARKALAVSQ